MVFSQPTFLFAFLPLVLVAHLLAPTRLRNPLLLLASLAFYAWGEGELVVLLAGSAIFNHVIGKRIVARAETGASPRGWIALGVALNLALLFVFKYAAWVLTEAASMTGAPSVAVAAEWSRAHLTLPLGISFFTFQAISYLIDMARRDAPPPRRASDFALYLALFPQLVAGPIVRYRDLAAGLAQRTVTSAKFADGARRFTAGLAKKVLIADVLAGPVDSIFALGAEGLSPIAAWTGCLAYTLQLYFDFSGYSDMAIGIGLMLGFRLPENFRHPYASGSVTEFWRRWHISLSSWFRDYLYIPLGGNRSGAVRTYVNLGVVFLLCGLWHGAAWTFVLWGAYHGALLIVERLGFGRVLSALPRAVAVGITLLFVAAAWVPFRAESWSQTEVMLRAMAGTAGAFSEPLMLHVDRHECLMLLVGSILAFPVAPGLGERLERLSGKSAYATLMSAGALVLLLLTIVAVSGQSHAPFLYFRF